MDSLQMRQTCGTAHALGQGEDVSICIPVKSRWVHAQEGEVVFGQLRELGQSGRKGRPPWIEGQTAL